MRQEYGKLAKVSVVTLVQLAFYYLIPYFILLALGVQNLNVVMIVSLNVLIFMITSLFPIRGTGGRVFLYRPLCQLHYLQR